MKKLQLSSPIGSLDQSVLDEQIAAAERSLAAAGSALPDALSVLPFVPRERHRRTGELLDPLRPRAGARPRPSSGEAALPQRLQFVLRKLRD